MAWKSDAAPELRELKKLGAAERSCPTVPLEVPARVEGQWSRRASSEDLTGTVSDVEEPP